MYKSQAPGLSFVEAAAAAPPTNLDELLNAGIRTVNGGILAALTLSMWSKAYAVPLDTPIDNNVARAVAKMNMICIDDAAGGIEKLAAELPLEKNSRTMIQATGHLGKV